MRSIDTGIYLRDDDDIESVIREDAAGRTHIYLDASPARSKVRDGATLTADAAPPAHGAPPPMVSSIREADPQDPKSGAQPAGGAFVCDFKRGRDGRWVGQDRAGRRYRLRVSHDGETYRVQPEDERPWSVKMGDKALADPSRALSAEQHQAGLGRLQGLLDSLWRRKDTGEAA